MSDTNNPVVTSFNGRSDIVILNSTDVQAALTFNPANDTLVLHTYGDTMKGNIDMNNYRVLNLPQASSMFSTEPARMLDLTNGLDGKSQRVFNGDTKKSYTVTVSPTPPSGGKDGDVWYRY